MKKRLMLVLLAVLCVVMLAACGECEHDWEKATCEEPKTCSECGETKGKAKGHEWVDATCEEPKTCSECGETPTAVRPRARPMATIGRMLLMTHPRPALSAA